MGVYHQMGHDSENLVRDVGGYDGAVLSPVNETKDRVRKLIEEHSSSGLEFIFDPQLYFPKTEREKLRAWSYFPDDVDTADLSDLAWWTSLNRGLVDTCIELGVRSVCSPAVVPSSFDAGFYRTCVGIASALVKTATDMSVLQTLVVNLPEMVRLQRVMEIASIASSTKADRVYVVFLVSEDPRREVAESQWMTGALRLIAELKASGMETLVGYCGPEAILYTEAGATACATGKFFNLRRFTPGRFDEPTGGGGQLSYWFEESLLAYLREADLVRVRKLDLLSVASQRNPFGQEILRELDGAPGSPWLAKSWRHYMQWFADVDRRLRTGRATAETLLATAEVSWERVEEAKLLMEEQRNDGRWVRPWRIAARSFLEDW